MVDVALFDILLFPDNRLTMSIFLVSTSAFAGDDILYLALLMYSRHLSINITTSSLPVDLLGR